MRTPHLSALDVAELYRTHAQAVFARSCSLLSEEEASDATQEIFLRALANRSSFRGESAPSTWLYQIAVNYCLWRRSRASRRSALLAKNLDTDWLRPSASADPWSAAALRELRERIDGELLDIAFAYYGEGRTHQDIADRTGLSRRTVGNRLNALHALTASMA